MRENRTSGSEGGGAKPITSPYPYFIAQVLELEPAPFGEAESELTDHHSRSFPLLQTALQGGLFWVL